LVKLYHEERMDGIKEAFEADVLLFPEVNPRKMMGCPCYMAGNKMFATLMDDAVVLTKLDDADRERLESEFGAGPFTHGSKVMGSWSKVPVKGEEDLAPLMPYVKRSYEAALGEYEG
jgi:hypothetical protein